MRSEAQRVFLAQLKDQSHRFPSLLLARFDPSLIPLGSTFADIPGGGLWPESYVLQLRN
jgi:hypothetical protein